MRQLHDLLPLYSVERVTKSEPVKIKNQTERDQLSCAFSYSYLVYLFTVFQVVTRDSNRPFASSPHDQFVCQIPVFFSSLVLLLRRMKTDIHNKSVLHRLSLKVRL